MALRRRAGIALAVWAIALSLLAVVSALPEGPKAVLRVDNASPIVGAAVHFNASESTGHDRGNGRIVGFRFVFGDGQETEWQRSPLAAHAYLDIGNFTATVTVIDQREHTGTASATIHVHATPPPPPEFPDVLPVALVLSPAQPRVNDSVNLTVTILNRGGTNATSATLDLYDVRPAGDVAFLGSMPLPHALAPDETESVSSTPFVAVQAGNHTIRAVVTNVTPSDPNATPHDLALTMDVLPRGVQPGSGGGGPSAFDVGPVAVVLSAAAVAAMAGAGYFLLRRPPKGPLEPPPMQPPDRSPPPIWPP